MQLRKNKQPLFSSSHPPILPFHPSPSPNAIRISNKHNNTILSLCSARHPTLIIIQKVLPVLFITRHPPYPRIPTYMFIDGVESNNNIEFPLPLFHRWVLDNVANNASVVGDLHDAEPEHLVTAQRQSARSGRPWDWCIASAAPDFPKRRLGVLAVATVFYPAVFTHYCLVERRDVLRRYETG